MFGRRTIIASTVLLFSVAVFASGATWHKITESAARTRMLKLQSKANGKKLVTIALTQFFFIVGKPRLTSSIKMTLREYNEGLNKEYWRLRQRCDDLNGIKPNPKLDPDHLVITSTIDDQNKYMADCVTFAVEALNIPQPNGKNKYFVIRPIIGGSIETFDSAGSKTPHRKQRTYSRSDFVNPKDIDWFFDVKDFSTHRHD